LEMTNLLQLIRTPKLYSRWPRWNQKKTQWDCRMESLVVINSSLFDTQVYFRPPAMDQCHQPSIASLESLRHPLPWVYNVPSNGPAGGCELASKIGRNFLLRRPGGVAVARATSFSEQYSDRQLKIMGCLSESRINQLFIISIRYKNSLILVPGRANKRPTSI